ncbi:MAG: hypothetical protein WBA93_37100 [Microcoleaceae cyanobacterium]
MSILNFLARRQETGDKRRGDKRRRDGEGRGNMWGEARVKNSRNRPDFSSKLMLKRLECGNYIELKWVLYSKSKL